MRIISRNLRVQSAHTDYLQADNDDMTTQGVLNGQPFNAGLDVDTQFLVFRVTLPTVAQGSVQQAIGISA